MLRDLPRVDRRLSSHDALLMNGTPEEHDHTRHDPLDDVFGSAPSSPAGHAAIDHDFRSGAERVEHSDVPRLRSIHVTNGYREGIAVSKEKYIQEGFDEGFSLGGEVGTRVGWLLGVLEGIHAAVKKLGRRGMEDGALQRFDGLLTEATSELKVEAVLGPEHFGTDGIWLYDVPGQDIEGQVTFADVAAAHPLLRKWHHIVLDLTKEYGLAMPHAKVTE